MISTDDMKDAATVEELARWLEDRIRDAQNAASAHAGNRSSEECGKVIAFSRCLNWIRCQQRKGR
jgi:hypothetical protein